ncbi:MULTISPECIES: deoxyribose-phosphate aldolase [Pseudoalteromonas]|uniref:Deoxyribose-phosphate aldolase n=1 Tax=Pseudoalteromonas haloplanktis TaxID=228 RepID=A0ABU1BHM9_PSEHA|nr:MULTISPECIES: deoxyribose-phosphate aldolase [Pseudoalteromonas]MCF6144382.1 deoxyribose-phosphate aldolase [Pseudoalteromonas mariniglutinosa NCIMB 1770]MDQ9093994.1 deoxyribose-phosphate aldolase [Pseudoalteromonas haloplanktis]TMN72321.1 deoxyribose-phosphate aldolase [Pseudoalteromonas sp. S1727]BDF96299.1 deoxyribose-phosphate aldolase 2 [Pseudoalteromonas sp. KAN5]
MTTQLDAATLAVKLMDLTSLNDDDTTASIQALITSIEPNVGIPAAVCVYSQFVADAKLALAQRELSFVKVATVTNFPTGNNPLNNVVNETLIAIERGADEIDLVMPYQALIDGDADTALHYVRASKELCPEHVQLKVIIESGELKTPELIKQATELAIAGGADFVKTSTGKVAINATLEATEIMLSTIKQSSQVVGFKAAGGVKTVSDASNYLRLAHDLMGEQYLQPTTFRFGASSLLTDVYTVLNDASE